MSTNGETVHPDLRQSIEAINLPELQELIEKLSKHGLAVALPHMHTEDGKLVPLPNDKVAYEDDQRVTFHQNDDAILFDAEPVMWGWDRVTQKVTTLLHCRGKQHH